MKRLTVLGTIFIALSMPLLGRSAFAAASVSLSPASSSVAKGSVLTISVYENSGGEPVNAAEIHLTYPADKFDFVSIGSSSSFSVDATVSGGGGNVTISRGALAPITGSKLVGSVRLKAKVNSGSGTVSIVGGTHIVSASSNGDIAGGLGSGTYTFKDPPPPPPPAAPPPPADTTAPTITDVKVSNITPITATVTWKTSEPATSEVVYGGDKNYGLSASDPNSVTDHKVVLNSPLISPGAAMHYMVKSADAAGNSVSSSDATFSTQGVTLNLTITDQSGKPAAGAKVTFGDSTGTTDKTGKVTLKDVPGGKQTGVVVYKGRANTVSTNIVRPDAKNTAQVASFKVKPGNNNPLLIIIPLIIFASALILLLKGGGPSGGNFIKKLTSMSPISKDKLPGKAKPSSESDSSVIKPSSVPQNK